MRAISLVIGMVLVTATTAASADKCKDILSFGVFERKSAEKTSFSWRQSSNWLCNSEFNSKQEMETSAANIGVVIEGIPMEVGGSKAESNFHEWYRKICSSNFVNSVDYENSSSSFSITSNSIVNAWSNCMQNANGKFITNKRGYGAGLVSFFVGHRGSGDVTYKGFNFISNKNPVSDYLSCPTLPTSGTKLENDFTSIRCVIDLSKACPGYDARSRSRAELDDDTVISFEIVADALGHAGLPYEYTWQCPTLPPPPPIQLACKDRSQNDSVQLEFYDRVVPWMGPPCADANYHVERWSNIVVDAQCVKSLKDGGPATEAWDCGKTPGQHPSTIVRYDENGVQKEIKARDGCMTIRDRLGRNDLQC